MATTATPYGLKAVNLIGGRVFAGSTRKIPIASGYNTNIFFGDVVKLSGGTIVKDTGTATATPIGVFMGCSYIDSVYGFTNRQMWTAGTAQQTNTTAYAFVCDDPYAVFQIQADGTVPYTAIGQNAALVQGSGSTISGDSAVTLNHTTATTNTLPLRIVDFVLGTTSTPGDAFTDCLVIWNAGMHLYNNATGTA